MKAVDVMRAGIRMSEFDIRLVEDMRDAPLVQPTPRGGNHPLWIVGHLAWAEGGLLSMLNAEPNPLEQWSSLFSAETEPVTDAAHYPSFDETLAGWRDMRARTMQLLDKMEDEDLDSPPAAVPPDVKEFFRTVADVFTFIPIHQAFHVGQLADARRAAGRKPIM